MFVYIVDPTTISVFNGLFLNSILMTLLKLIQELSKEAFSKQNVQTNYGHLEDWSHFQMLRFSYSQRSQLSVNMSIIFLNLEESEGLREKLE